MTRTGEHPRLRLAVLSFLMLFVALALMRWTAPNDILLACLANLVLLASFLGMGLGFLRAGSGPDLFRWAPVALALLIAFVLAFPVSLVTLRGPNQLHGAFGWSPLPKWVGLSVIFFLSVATMAG